MRINILARSFSWINGTYGWDKKARPSKATAASGIDALTHALESFTSKGAAVLTDTLALESVKQVNRSIRTAVWNGNDVKARKDVGLPTSIKDNGVQEEDLDQMTEDAMEQTRLLKKSPKSLKSSDIRKIYQEAYDGILDM